MRWIVVLLALGFCADCFGQDCSNVIALSKTVRTVVSDQREVQHHASNFCDDYRRHRRDTSRYQFGASFSFLSGGGEGGSMSADEVASKYCSASNAFRARDDSFKQYIETIAPGAYTAYEQCLLLTNQDVKFNVNVGSVLPKEFSLTASFTSSTGQTDTKIDYTSSSDVICKWDGQDGNTKILPTGRSSILKCTRDNASTRSSVTVVWTGSGLGLKSLTLPWQAYDSAGTPVDSLASLTRGLASLADRVEGNTRDLSRIRFDNGSVMITAAGTRALDDGTQCPTSSGNQRGVLSGRVTFSTPFVSPPKVTVGLSELDMTGDSNRIAIVVTGVDERGFNYSFYTWCYTKVFRGTATWMAAGR